ncbi:hypothetical protein SDC9_188941 [bioreactor metagenome]|uniref:Uncharacterized protein n=1 Tax=bioreactor metagenome TaxID=1076179 RepID=A0A645HQQ6_9ZZZZ
MARMFIVPLKLPCHQNGILGGMVIIAFSPAGRGEAVLAVKRDRRLVGGSHLQREKGQLLLPEAEKRRQKLLGNTLPAPDGGHGDIGDIALVQHRMESGIAQHLARLVLGNQVAGAVVIQLLGQHGLRPGGGKAGPLNGGDARQVAPVHGLQLIGHPVSIPFFSGPRPSFCPRPRRPPGARKGP